MEELRSKDSRHPVIKWIAASLIYSLIVLSLLNSSTVAMNIAAFASIIYVLLFDISSSLLLLTGLTVFENAVKINGILAWFFVILFIIIKYLLTNNFRIYTKRKNAIYASFFLALVAFFTDAITYGIKGQMLTTIVLVLFMGLIVGIDENWQISASDVVFYLGTSFTLAVIFMLNQYGGIKEFINLFLNSAYAYRFGHSFGDTVGGAMAIPIYALLIISFSLYMLLGDSKSRICNVLVVILDVIAFVFGALTISRSFYAGLVIVIAVFFLSKTQNSKARKTKSVLIIIIAICTIIAINSFYDVFVQTINNLFSRIDAGGGTGERTDIWLSCFDYLLENPVGFLFGFGSNGYPIIGEKLGLLFSAGSHNLYFDILMSWGIIGCICVLIILHQLRPHEGFSVAIQKNMIAFLPLLVLLFFCLTAMRSNSMKTVIYFFCCFILINKDRSNDTYEKLNGQEEIR